MKLGSRQMELRLADVCLPSGRNCSDWLPCSERSKANGRASFSGSSARPEIGTRRPVAQRPATLPPGESCKARFAHTSRTPPRSPRPLRIPRMSDTPIESQAWSQRTSFGAILHSVKLGFRKVPEPCRFSTR